jgi:putative addiction module killer protein
MIVRERKVEIFNERVGNISSFKKWLNRLGRKEHDVVLARLVRMSLGNYGDCKSVGNGIQELRFHQGYRIYFSEVGNTVVLLFCGGDKSNQEKDIAKAREYKKILDEKGLDYCIEK